MRTTSFRHISYLVDFLVSNGIEDVIISPGSRNAPLIIAFDAHPNIKTHLIHDERVAAFYALGMADASDKPVAVTCTSGTALLNYAPAVAEAYYREVPLLVLSADRPEELIDQGDGQTIRQTEVYRNFIVSSHTYSSLNDNGELEKALSNLINLPKGPVHINLPFEEPLYGIEERGVEKLAQQALKETPKLNGLKNLNQLETIWKNSEKKMIIVGQHNPDPKWSNVLQLISNDPSVSILVENTSNVQNFTRICHNIDRTLAGIKEDELEKFQPDLLISIGGAVVSKRIKALLRNYKAKNTWRVGNHLIEEDTYQSAAHMIHIEPTDLLQHLVDIDQTPNSNFGSLWKQRDFLSQEAHERYMSTIPFSDLKVFQQIFDLIPDNANLHMANSSVVRYCQLFNPISGIEYYSNRGVSGIDGSSSTAAGFSLKVRDKLNVLISGDISFFYDSNAFWNNELGDNLKVIVISNGGGGIFEFIAGPPSTDQAHVFFAETNAIVQGICQAFDLNYLVAENEIELNDSLQTLFYSSENSRPTILEIKTQQCENARILTSYFEYIAEQNA
ncbi:MAG: 2-succinyl-5-enolpyruvyl-6-hydroxy-3-cyclohexene-1-carboxylic-acid synthase [Crocinitomicaceae bacterium]|nr:2-succinyl-5-enolpyruvyl-6-hydroxy-3-cyclohexene-1-carboxylic-acid synthase [Crocinitomicaceae bacterium]